MNKGTTTTLIKDLEKCTGIRRQVDIIIDRAKNNEYHDFKSELPAPKIGLFRDLQLIGLDDLAQNVMAGEYDEV